MRDAPADTRDLAAAQRTTPAHGPAQRSRAAQKAAHVKGGKQRAHTKQHHTGKHRQRPGRNRRPSINLLPQRYTQRVATLSKQRQWSIMDRIIVRRSRRMGRISRRQRWDNVGLYSWLLRLAGRRLDGRDWVS